MPRAKSSMSSSRRLDVGLRLHLAASWPNGWEAWPWMKRGKSRILKLPRNYACLLSNCIAQVSSLGFVYDFHETHFFLSPCSACWRCYQVCYQGLQITTPCSLHHPILVYDWLVYLSVHMWCYWLPYSLLWIKMRLLCPTDEVILAAFNLWPDLSVGVLNYLIKCSILFFYRLLSSFFFSFILDLLVTMSVVYTAFLVLGLLISGKKTQGQRWWLLYLTKWKHKRGWIT